MKNTFPSFINTALAFVRNYRKTSIFIGLCILAGIYYFFFGHTTVPTRYVTSNPTQGTLVTSVTGTGQMSAETQIDLKPQVSSTVTHIYVTTGDIVKKGQTLFTLDSRDAQKTERDAEIDLATAKLNLQKLQEPATDLDLIQTQDAINQAEQSKKDAQLAVDNAHETLLNSSVTAVTNATNNTDTAPTISGSYLGTDEGQINVIINQAGSGGYFSTTGLVNTTGALSTTTPQPIGDTGLYIKFATTNNQTNWIINLPNKQAPNYISNYNAYQNALQSQAQTIASADNTIAEQTAKLKQLNTGTDPLDIQAAQLAVQQKQNALTDAQETLSNYYITAPFDGVIATVGAQIGQPSSSGTALGTIITNEKIAVIPFNEVDVAKIQVGQKVTMTFDAIDSLEMTGSVTSVDAVGTVSSGVVNYNVKISLDTNDDRVKSGMSVTAAVITDVEQDVLMVPTSAIKNNTQGSYVEVFDTALPDPLTGVIGSPSTTLPRKQTVVLGNANDTDTIITSGLDENSIIVTRTITPTTTATTSSTPSILNSVGGSSTRGLGGGGGTRATTGR